MKKIFLVIAFLFLIVSQGLCQESPLQLTIKSDKEVYEAGDEIIISGYFKNVSSEKVYLVKTPKPLLWCRLIVIDPKGYEFWWYEDSPPLTPIYSALLQGEMIQFTLKAVAGEANDHNWLCQVPIEGRIDYPFRPQGIYKVKFQFEFIKATVKDNIPKLSLPLTSNTISIEVKAKGGISLGTVKGFNSREGKENILKEEAIKLVQDYIRKQNIKVIDINTPSEIREYDDSWVSITYAIEQEPVFLPPFRSFNVHKDTGEIYESLRE